MHCPSTGSLAIAGILAASLGGCASPCARVRTRYEDITRPSQAAAGDHIRLSIPRALVDTVVAREVRTIPSPRLPLPEVAGVDLGTVSVHVQKIRLLPAAQQQVAFSISLSLRSGRKAVLPIVVQAVAKPRLDPDQERVVVALDEVGLVELDAKLGRGGTRALTDALWSELPAAARMITSKKQLAGVADSLANRLLGEATKVVERELLDDLGRVARVEIDLPPIEVDSIRVRSTERDIVVGFHTRLSSDHALPEALSRTSPPHQVELAVHGSVATAFVNRAMVRGEVPSRFDLDGAADPTGPLHAYLDWSNRASKPLLVHAFLLDPQAAGRSKKDCAHVTLGATPRVIASDGHLRVSTRDAKVEEVEGSVAVKAGLFFGGVSRRSFEHVETVATDTEFELGAQTLRARVEGARLHGSNLILGLSLSPARPG